MKNADSEKLVERKLVEKCKENGALCIKLLTYQFIGLPDRLCLFPNGVVVFVELKTTGQKPRKIQTNIHDKLRKLGFRVDVIDSLDQVQGLIDELTCE